MVYPSEFILSNFLIYDKSQFFIVKNKFIGYNF